MAELKTKSGKGSVTAFIGRIKDPEMRADATALVAMMRKATGAPPRLWGTSIVGFGTYHYVYESGREGDWFLLGFAPRKKELTVYLMCQSASARELRSRLGPHKERGSCLYIRRLSEIHRPTLQRLLAASVRETKRRFG